MQAGPYICPLGNLQLHTTRAILRLCTRDLAILPLVHVDPVDVGEVAGWNPNNQELEVSVRRVGLKLHHTNTVLRDLGKTEILYSSKILLDIRLNICWQIGHFLQSFFRIVNRMSEKQ